MAIKPDPIPTVIVEAGTELHRVHWARDGARFYGLRNAGWRFDDPLCVYGVIYLAEDGIASFGETLLRWPATKRDLMWSDVEARRTARFKTKRDLKLALLHGAGPAAFGLAPSELTGDDYTECQAVSAIVHAEGSCDGIRYRSRFENDLFCMGLFERADGAIELIEEGQSIDRDWTFDICKERGYRLLDL